MYLILMSVYAPQEHAQSIEHTPIDDSYQNNQEGRKRAKNDFLDHSS